MLIKLRFGLPNVPFESFLHKYHAALSGEQRYHKTQDIMPKTLMHIFELKPPSVGNPP
ncbi:conserved hypothetical protein [Vibrio coralliirubri]|nr:conserved hypothetical protein [Vibrio coralliirubri]CDT78360.1 conserved hypothetical protein [Vibrio coralliirubri]